MHDIAPAAARKSVLMLGGRAEAGTNFNVAGERRLCDAPEGFETGTLQEEPAAATLAQDPLGKILSRYIAKVTSREPRGRNVSRPA